MADAAAQYLALGVCGWLLLALIWLNLRYRADRKRMSDAEIRACDEDAELENIIW